MFRSIEDQDLVDAIRAMPRVRVDVDLVALFARAERHGLAGVLHEAYVAAEASLPSELERGVVSRALARDCDHAAHLEMLARIDRAFVSAELSGVALKGALLAERLYERPSVRPTTDIDLLVREGELDSATRALASVGYEASEHPTEEHFRTAGHHIHLFHPAAPCVELHFHAFRGFGRILRAEPLIERGVGFAGLKRLRVLAPSDELVYLATHAAGHRFMRIGWLYDLLLLAKKLDDTQLVEAWERAREVGMTRPLAFALVLLEDLFGWRAPALGARRGIERRRSLLTALAEEPEMPLARSATRFAYSLALCEDWRSAVQYTRDAVGYRLRGHAEHG